MTTSKTIVRDTEALTLKARRLAAAGRKDEAIEVLSDANALAARARRMGLLVADPHI